MPRYIVNAGGAFHSVGDAEFQALVARRGWREASTEEARRWYESQGLPVPPDLLPQQAADASSSASTVHKPDLPPAGGGGGARKRGR